MAGGFPSEQTSSPGQIALRGNTVINGGINTARRVLIDGQACVRGQIITTGQLLINGEIIIRGALSIDGYLSADRNATMNVEVSTSTDGKVSIDGSMVITGQILFAGRITIAGSIVINGVIVDVSAASEVLPWELRMPVENDFKIQDAVVYLYTRPLRNYFISYVTNSEAFRHWALVVHFLEDNSWRTLEALSENFKIYANYTVERPEGTWEHEEIAKVQTSPAHLRAFAISNPFNDQPYIVDERNCQEWVLQLAKAWEGGVEKLNTFDTLSKKTLVGFVCRYSLNFVCSLHKSPERIKDKPRSYGAGVLRQE